MFFKNNFDFVAIGETTIDAFIRLRDATVRCDINNENCQLCVNFCSKIHAKLAVLIIYITADCGISQPDKGINGRLPNGDEVKVIFEKHNGFILAVAIFSETLTRKLYYDSLLVEIKTSCFWFNSLTFR